eukprot:6185026-Pleurochrysis_carterae.AAC.2
MVVSWRRQSKSLSQLLPSTRQEGSDTLLLVVFSAGDARKSESSLPHWADPTGALCEDARLIDPVEMTFRFDQQHA